MNSRISLRARRAVLALFASVLPLALAQPGHAQDRSIVMASTTSTEQSGLFPHLLPAFTKATGMRKVSPLTTSRGKIVIGYCVIVLPP